MCRLPGPIQARSHSTRRGDVQDDVDLVSAGGDCSLGETDSAPDSAVEVRPGLVALAGAEGAYAAPAPATARAARKTRKGTKQAQLIAMLERPEGATFAEVVAATGWQPHTVRGAIAGALKKKLGLNVVSGKVENRGRVYRITG